MERVFVDCVYGRTRGQIMWRDHGIELASSDKNKPLQKPDEPVVLRGIHVGEFAALMSVKTSLWKPGYTSTFYLITQVNRGAQQAVAVPRAAVLEHPESLCTPYLRYALEELGPEDLADFDLTSLGQYVLQTSTER